MRTLSAATLAAIFACAYPALAQPGGFSPLFDGKTLAGWRVEARPADLDKNFWTVRDGAIHCDSRGRKDHDCVWLVSEGEYADFDLKLKVRGFRDCTGNSGVQVRSRYVRDAGWMDGPQADVHPPAPWRTGLLYDETRGTQRWIFPSLPDWKIDASHAPAGWTWKYAGEGDGWNDLEIVCRGTHIATRLNGRTAADFDGRGVLDDDSHRHRNTGLRGHLAFQLHTGDELLIDFKDVGIRLLD